MLNEMKYTNINLALQKVNRGGVKCVFDFTFFTTTIKKSLAKKVRNDVFARDFCFQSIY